MEPLRVTQNHSRPAKGGLSAQIWKQCVLFIQVRCETLSEAVSFCCGQLESLALM